MNNLSGRIDEAPSFILNEEILEPQFKYEIENLLPSYIKIEQAMLLEYIRMGYISKASGSEIASKLQSINKKTIHADLEGNFSDIAFAIEKQVERTISIPAPSWHVDRSRNDFQACAQIMFARDQWLESIEGLICLIRSSTKLAKKYIHTPMPGFTHYQSAQIITPGFYISAINSELLQIVKRWLDAYDEINKCPLGAGGMAGVELNWNQSELAKLLGFSAISNNALCSIASRGWALNISAELSTFSVLISRFVTDLISWGSSEYNFIDLPDNLSGISSAMPQKKNFPILERLRGRSAHLSTYYVGIVLGQRNTPYTNLVETSKEAGSNIFPMFKTVKSLIRLLITVVEKLSFNEDRMFSICQRDFFGGFTLSNLLTVEFSIPFRKAQVIVGNYIKVLSKKGIDPIIGDAQLLTSLCEKEGFVVMGSQDLINLSFDVKESLFRKSSIGSTNPIRIMELLKTQDTEIKFYKEQLSNKKNQILRGDLLRKEALKGIGI
ncbi:argininosuccinate lyase [Shouchella lehensis]|uniref:argininosuccinate lyase n=1 Tax=Shouchella lehensis G1 TaxID=1246626 RepID=A0A060LZ81_9BACI|nr:lyase family protein [Shouchella lehensis]AIC93104.1 argininosuccinate lyase [Shouchella lehensis G1]